jgi:hypothetical protein
VAVLGYSPELVGHSVRVWTCSSWVFQLLSQFPYVFPSFSSFYVPTSVPHETFLQYILFCTLSVYLSLNINYDFPSQPQSPVSLSSVPNKDTTCNRGATHKLKPSPSCSSSAQLPKLIRSSSEALLPTARELLDQSVTALSILPIILRCAILGSPQKCMIREIYATVEAKN